MGKRGGRGGRVKRGGAWYDNWDDLLPAGSLRNAANKYAPNAVKRLAGDIYDRAANRFIGPGSTPVAPDVPKITPPVAPSIKTIASRMRKPIGISKPVSKGNGLKRGKGWGDIWKKWTNWDTIPGLSQGARNYLNKHQSNLGKNLLEATR